MVNSLKFDPLTNAVTSKVFYELILGKTTPKGIADALGVRSPTIIEHLWRLQRIGIVTRGEKIGKYQHYVINWKVFSNIFMERAPTSVGTSIKLSYRYFINNKPLQALLQEWLTVLIRDYLKPANYRAQWPTTVAFIIESFEQYLVQCFPSFKELESKDPETQQLLSELEEWFNAAKDMKHPIQASLTVAFQKVLRST